MFGKITTIAVRDDSDMAVPVASQHLDTQQTLAGPPNFRTGEFGRYLRGVARSPAAPPTSPSPHFPLTSSASYFLVVSLVASCACLLYSKALLIAREQTAAHTG